MKLHEATRVGINQQKIWMLSRMYLLFSFILARDFHFNKSSEQELPDQYKAEVTRFYKKCLSEILEEKSIPLFVSKTLQSFADNQNYYLEWYKDNTPLTIFDEIFPISLNETLKELMFHIWNGKVISSAIEDGQFVIYEDAKPIASAMLDKDGPGTFLSVHMTKKSREFFSWTLKYFKIKKPPTEEEWQGFDEAKKRKYK